MEIKPVNGIEKPKYPQKQQIDIEEIKRAIPKRWRASPAAKIALGTLAAVTLAGCTPPYVPTGSPAPAQITTEQTVTPGETYYQTAGVPMAPAVNVAPLFIHGEGRGAYGCVMVAPPVFLSEEDALAVINEAAQSYGLKFSAEGSPEFTNVPQPVTNIYEPEDKAPSDKTMTFKADFTDSEHGVIIEFITTDDVKQWHKDTGYGVSMESYDTKDTAEQLSEGLEQAIVSGGYYSAAVLYDPCEFSEDTDVKPLSEEQLKKQAIDFFEWLKNQGIIK